MGKTYYIFSSGTLRRRENTLLFEGKDKRKVIPVENVEEIFVFGEIGINTKLLGLLNKHGIVMHFFNHYGWYMGSFYPRETNVSGFLVVKQVEHYTDPHKRLYLAKSFVEGAIKNLHYVVSEIDIKEAITNLKTARSINDVMNIEGNLRKIYYNYLENITSWEFVKRSRRPPQNPLNALISFGNSLVYSTVLKEIYTTQLLPTISYLHEPSSRRFSLALDISEIFKPLLSDKLIINLINSGKISENDFSDELNYTYLNDRGRKTFIKEYDKTLSKTLKHKKLRRKVSLRRIIRIECYKLIKHLLGERAFTPFCISRGS